MKVANEFNSPKKISKKAMVIPSPKKDNPDKYGKENCCVKQYWAVVDRNGSLIRGRSVLRVAKLGTGRYEVFFTGDVREGVYVATIGRHGIGTEPTGQIGVALRYPGNPTFMPFEDNNGVWVDTHDSNGRPSDRAFHLLVNVH